MENIKYKIGVIGLGFVGKAIYDDFTSKGLNIIGHDIINSPNTFEECLESEIIFLALPTKFNSETNEYDKSIIESVCQKLEQNNYQGILVNKSTIEPTTTQDLELKYNTLKFIHNPEFLTARTALEDFKNQSHIVLGIGNNINESEKSKVEELYASLYPSAKISLCKTVESESMKIFLNCFYAVKVQFFNEIYLLCEKTGADFETVRQLMLNNNWINPMHTNVPGPDGELSYGGYCFPKDTNALANFMKVQGTPNEVLKATISERNKMRKDNDNVI